ncbi:hypothetical protein D3C76_1419530 [compost metagenome]
MTKLKKITGDRIGSVMLKKRRKGPAPSTAEASSYSGGICFKPARKIIIDDPNCHTDSSTIEYRAYFGLATQSGALMPIMASTPLSRPSPPSILRHSIAMATLPPSRVGI